MTALTQFLRLEASGVWRPDADAPAQEVIVSLGDATLTISDIQGTVLGHWALGAISRSNPDALPARFHPHGDPDQTLELPETEPEMIEGITRVLRSLRHEGPRRGPIRRVLKLGALAAGIALLACAPILLRHVSVAKLPAATRAELGQDLLREGATQGLLVCRAPGADAALRKLATQALGPAPRPRVMVARGMSTASSHLPGPIILLSDSFLRRAPGPAIAVQRLRAERAALDAQDPVLQMLEQAGLFETLRLLTSGAISETALARHMAARLADPMAPARDVQGTTPTDGPTFDDADWVRLQGICDG